MQEAFGQYQRVQVSRNTAPLNSSPPLGPRAFDFWAIGFNLAWEVDVWERFRRNIEAASADLDASVEDYDAILVCLLVDTAATYTEIRTLQQKIEYASSNVEMQKGSLGIAEAQFRNGAVTELDVTQARTILEQTEAAIPVLKAALR